MYDSETHSKKRSTLLVLTLSDPVPGEVSPPQEYEEYTNPEYNSRKKPTLFTLTLGVPIQPGRPPLSYSDLVDKPSINGITLEGDYSFEELVYDGLLLDCGTSEGV